MLLFSVNVYTSIGFLRVRNTGKYVSRTESKALLALSVWDASNTHGVDLNSWSCAQEVPGNSFIRSNSLQRFPFSTRTDATAVVTAAQGHCCMHGNC